MMPLRNAQAVNYPILEVVMDYKQWVDLFGYTTDDKNLQEAIAKAGIKTIPQIERDETDVREDIVGEGITLVFIDATLLDKQALVEGPAVLAEVIMILQHPIMKDVYKGPLPFNLQHGNSQASLRKCFGKPIEYNEDFRWDRWKIDDLILTVNYSKDLGSLNRLCVGLPRDE